MPNVETVESQAAELDPSNFFRAIKNDFQKKDRRSHAAKQVGSAGPELDFVYSSSFLTAHLFFFGIAKEASSRIF